MGVCVSVLFSFWFLLSQVTLLLPTLLFVLWKDGFFPVDGLMIALVSVYQCFFVVLWMV